MRPALPVLLWAVALAPLPAAAQRPSNDVTLDSLLGTRVSTASKYSQTMAQTPTAVTIISAADIARHGWRDLSDVFATVRGLYISNDRNYPYLGVRGFSRPTDYNNRILVLIDGHRTNDDVYGSSAAGTDLALDLSTLERIEIVRGPGSALYGTNAMLATVNLITRSARQSDPWRVAVGGGTGGERRGSVRLARYDAASGLGGTLSAFVGERDGSRYDFPEFASTPTRGRTSGTDYEHRYQVLGNVTKGGLSFAAYTNWRDKGIPTGAFDVTFDDPLSHTIDVNQFAEARYTTDATQATQYTARLAFDRYWYHGGYAYSTGLQRETVESSTYTGEAYVRRDLSSDNRIIAGLEYRSLPTARYTSRDGAAITFQRDGSFRVMSLYVQDEQQISPTLSVLVGARRDDYRADLGYTTPRVALVWNPRASTTVKLMYGEAFRAPSESETELLQVGYKPNHSLRPERLNTLQADIHERLDDEWVAMASAYSFDVTDLIDPKLDPIDSLLQPRNVGHARSFGVELELSGRLGSGWNVYVNGSLGRSRDATTDMPLSNSPEWSLKGGASRRVAEWTGAIDTRYEAPRRSVGGLSSTGALLLDAHVAWGGTLGGIHHELSLYGRNLLNTAFVVPGGAEHRQAFLPMGGRSLVLQLALTP